MWTSITSGKRNITVDLPLVANFVSGWYKPGKDSASKISGTGVLGGGTRTDRRSGRRRLPIRL